MNPIPGTLGVGIVGVGFMGATHAAAYRSAREAGCEVKLVAVCGSGARREPTDASAEESTNLDTGADREALAVAHRHASPAALFADPSIVAVSICTPTNTHVDVAAAALRAGKHVLLEKPVALEAEAIRKLAALQRETGRVCMVGMCMRFWPGWSELLAAAREGRDGSLMSARFHRRSQRPGWGMGFYTDPARCGGALFDFHVHDADLVRKLAGEPSRVHTTGSLDEPRTSYRFSGDNAPSCIAEASWALGEGQPFQMAYEVEFERARWSWDLVEPGFIRRQSSGGEERLAVDSATGYELEIQHFLNCLAEGRDPGCGLEDAAGTVALLEAERRSLESGRPVEL